MKRKTIVKKKDPVLDSKEEIRKWIEARKKNYPRKDRNQPEGEIRERTAQEEVSLLEKKIRKKLVLINGDAKSVVKKQKDLDILRRFILFPRKPKKPFVRYDRQEGRPMVEEIHAEK